MADPIPARRGHKKSASTSALAMMAAGPSPSPSSMDHAFRDLTNTRPEERQRSSRSRMTTAPSNASKESARMEYLPGIMSPRRSQRETEQTSQSSSLSIPDSPSSSRLARSGHSRKSRLSTYTSASDTLHESTEEDDPPSLRPYTPHRLAPADIPIPPSPAIRRSATSSTLTDETPRSKHQSQRSPRKSNVPTTGTPTSSSGFRRSESMYVMTDTTGSEVDTPKRSKHRRPVGGAEEGGSELGSGTPLARSSRRKSERKRNMTVPMALDTILSLRASHTTRLTCLTYLEKKLAEACPVKLTTEVEPGSPLSLMLSYSLHIPLLSLFGRHLSLMDQTNAPEQSLMEIEVTLNILQGLCMLELGLGVGERRCAGAMSCSWVFEALVDLLLLLRKSKSTFSPDLSLKVQLHCISTSFILLLHSESNTQAFIDAGGIRGLEVVATDGDGDGIEAGFVLTQGMTNSERIKQQKELKLKCLEVCYFVSLDRTEKDRLARDVSGTTTTTAEVGTEGNRSSSNSSSGTALTDTTAESSLLRTPNASYFTEATSVFPSSNSSSRGYESERSEKSTHATYLAPFAPSTPKKTLRTGMPKSSSSQGLGYWTPQVKSRVRHDAVDLRDDQGLGSGQGALFSGIPPRRPSSSTGFRGMLNQVTEEHASPKGLFGEDLGPLMRSTTRSEAKGSSGRAVSSGSEASEVPVRSCLPPRLPNSKSYIGLGMPGRARGPAA